MDKKWGNYMGILIFIIVFLFVLGSALLLLRSANSSKIPDGVKPQPYEDDE